MTTEAEIVELPVVFFAANYVVDEMLFTAGAVAKAVPLCEGLPITVSHPYVDGVERLFKKLRPVEERPAWIEANTVGYVRSPEVVYPRLQATAEINISRVRELSPKLAGNIEAGEVVYCCVGWYNPRGIKRSGWHREWSNVLTGEHYGVHDEAGLKQYKFMVTETQVTHLALEEFRYADDPGNLDSGHCPINRGFGLGHRKELCNAG